MDSTNWFVVLLVAIVVGAVGFAGYAHYMAYQEAKIPAMVVVTVDGVTVTNMSPRKWQAIADASLELLEAVAEGLADADFD